MKKLCFFFSFIVFLCGTVMSQNKAQKIWIGPNLATVAVNNFDGGTPFEYGSNFVITLGVSREKTFHNFLYLTKNNTLRVLSGWLTSWGDVYVCANKSLSTPDKFVGIGVEKLFKISENVKIFPFTEIGTNLKGNHSFVLGVVMPIQMTIWKRK